MELVLGKKFKFEVWEVIVQMMALNEVATFTVDKSVSIWRLYCLFVSSDIFLNYCVLANWRCVYHFCMILTCYY
jgi:hypothetical protein